MENVFSHVSIHGRQGVIQNIDVCILIGRSGQADALLLAPTEIDALKKKSISTSPVPQSCLRGGY